MLILFFEERKLKATRKNGLKELILEEKKIIRNEEILYEEFQKKIRLDENVVFFEKKSTQVDTLSVVLESSPPSEDEIETITAAIQKYIEKESVHAD